MESNHEQLVKALRCKRDDCEGCDLAFFDKDEGWMCQYAAKDDDAADAIEALQAEQKKTVTQIFGEEQQKWTEYCTALGNRIKELEQQMPKRGEIVRCGECKYWSEVDTSDGLRYGQCDYPHSAIRGNCFIRESWFCADGEREVQE